MTRFELRQRRGPAGRRMIPPPRLSAGGHQISSPTEIGA
eukprot:CAMPEP_0203967338 /NCGR_PEP_ID=MMETSP0359-20131031/96358_1 /ASSEMBLY_ACC=CAM_ASM_000338 /TAXON_ID=268821 /ORGANISM="Scrippsiella Hangoei, Strain SHTV-5" /LENGTH=38 /DNA_ID= /DNA_START= /DNA_END= /DNA_ORIENTATION=